MNVKKTIAENKKRYNELFGEYDPITGEGSPLERIPFRIFKNQKKPVLIPVQMEELTFVDDAKDSSLEEVYADNFDDMLEIFNKARLKYDFEFWAFVTAKIKPKGATDLAPFKCRRAQLKLLKSLEHLRVSLLAIFIILCKARQWGGSTLIQIYMAWIQIIHKERWSSLVVGEVEAQAVNVRKLYQTLVDNYPEEVQAISIKPFEGSSKNKEIPERNCVINLGSMQKPDNIRSADINMAHLTEVGLWKKTEGKSPRDLVQSILGTIPNKPYSLYVLESTAKGIGNFFHNEWQAAVAGDSNLTPVFVAWFEIEMYVEEFESEEERIQFIKGLNEYEMFLWNLGATLEGIKWYRGKLRDYNGDVFSMRSEFPSTAQEAFQSSGRRAFPEEHVHNIRKTIMKPAFTGDLYPNSLRGPEALEQIMFEDSTNGDLRIWHKPNDPPVEPYTIMRNRYAAFVDIGGKSKGADYSVVSVFDRYYMEQGYEPVRVATWRGHLDQDLFAWKAVQIAMYYENALLAIESNSLTKYENTEGSHYLTILDEIADHYDNLFTRTKPELIAEGAPKIWGFHTNTSTKGMLVNNFKAMIRDRTFVEYDQIAVDEADIYELKDDGNWGNIEGKNNHDDVLVTTMGALWLATKHMDLPVVRQLKRPTEPKRKRNKAKSAKMSSGHFG